MSWVPTVDASVISSGLATGIEPPFSPSFHLQLIVECKTLIN